MDPKVSKRAAGGSPSESSSEPTAVSPPATLPLAEAPTDPALKADEQKPAPVAAAPRDPDDLFVSCVPESGPVARFIATATPKTGPYSNAPFIGAERDMSVEGNLRYFPERVEMIPGKEYRAYSKEYRRALADRSLRMRTRAEWETQQAAAESGTGG